MSRVPNDTQTMSLKLSEVLSDIGVTEKMVLKRRRIFMLMETVDTHTHRLLGKNAITYNFGSQSEGSTTMDLDSDIDSLFNLRNLNVIQDWKEWRFGEENVLMVQDESTSPGYCLLQFLRSDVPLVDTSTKPGVNFGRDIKRRLLMKNSCFEPYLLQNQYRNGPAFAFKELPGFNSEDNVLAWSSKSWPADAKPWLERPNVGGWPTEEVKRYCENTGCFLVPVSSKSDRNEAFEWRISTSLAERCLMFNLNITQIRCYVLLKMIIKTFIKPQCDDVISSFMCKNVLFYCIENTLSKFWEEQNLLACLEHCLSSLQNCITRGNCPHFIIPGNNLMAGKLSPEHKRSLHEILNKIIQSGGRTLLEIQMDNLGGRLEEKIQGHRERYPSPDFIRTSISSKLLKHIAIQVHIRHKFHMKEIVCRGGQIEYSKSLVHILAKRYIGEALSNLERSAYKLLIPFLCSCLGSAIASRDIHTDRTVSQEAKDWFSVGLNSDVSSGRLKFASALYCSGDFERAELILRNTEDLYDLKTVETVCTCRDLRKLTLWSEFFNRADTGNEELMKHITAFCVRFIPCEINCVPYELQYEMFRAPPEDKLHIDDFWMDWSVVDSLPYIHFLQYKTYGHLHRRAGQEVALERLIDSIARNHNLGHLETALNLLGQCYEQEKIYNSALDCYVRSLNECARNNVAKMHICRLISALVNGQVV